MSEVIDTSFTIIEKSGGGGCETQSSSRVLNLAFVDIQLAYSLADRGIVSQITFRRDVASWRMFDIIVVVLQLYSTLFCWFIPFYVVSLIPSAIASTSILSASSPLLF